MKHVILGTAGHIDHGKTSLVKALTGVDTDRLKEEKERGITIELGFTFLDLPSGIRLGIVDVPGHERFVKHMVAGAWGIDLVALVIAGDEGVMPQTKEHLDICTLLRVKKGLIILTKMDLVDRELLDMVREEVTDAVRNTFLKEAPILAVSSTTGEGIPQLISVLDHLSQKVEERSSVGLFRLPIDRVFIMKGFGTVATGTIVSGGITLGKARSGIYRSIINPWKKRKPGSVQPSIFKESRHPMSTGEMSLPGPTPLPRQESLTPIWNTYPMLRDRSRTERSSGFISARIWLPPPSTSWIGRSCPREREGLSS